MDALEPSWPNVFLSYQYKTGSFFLENQEDLLFMSISVNVRTVTLALLATYVLTHANADFEAEIKALCIKDIHG